MLAALWLAPTAAAQVPAPPTAPAPPPQPPQPAQPPQPPQPRIAPGVSAAGVGLGGLTLAEATQRLIEQARPRVQARFNVRAGRRLFVLTTHRLRLRFDEAATARRAMRAGSRLAPGERVNVNPVVAFRRARARAFAQRAASASAVAPRDATIRITLRRIVGRRAHYGRAISGRALEVRILRALADPTRSRSLRPRFRRVRPRTRLVELRRIHRTILTVDRAGFRLRVFRRLRYARSYPIAVGAAGTETPAGLRRVQTRQVNPAWTAPNRPWAGSYAGRTVPGGAPDNPLRARWLGLGGGVGIHGTGESWSIGSRASHGCIRMRVEDVVELYPRVPLGTSVLIG
jgi:L,D-transpeptidase catalytic domain